MVLKRRAKRIIKIVFPDGVFTVLDIDEDKQTNMLGVWIKKGIFGKPTKVSIPRTAIPNFDSNYILKNRKAYLVCFNYDSKGNTIPDYGNVYSNMINQIIQLENENKSLKNDIISKDQTINQKSMTEDQMWNKSVGRMKQLSEDVIQPMSRRVREKPVYIGGEQYASETGPEEG